jgi:serine/threonine-protein kinase
VHRDVKPGNIMYESDSRHATVTDFGVACLTDASRTKTGTILGSPSYMSPEQLEGVRIDGRSDLFSLGVTLFQLLTGQLPFVADSLSSLMYRIANESHPDPCKLRSDLPSCARAIINRALQKNAERRYANAAQMATALRRCGEKAGA